MKQAAKRTLYPRRPNSTNPDGNLSWIHYVPPGKCWVGTYFRIDHNDSKSFEN
jgi:hypothetical protein